MQLSAIKRSMAYQPRRTRYATGEEAKPEKRAEML